MEDKLKEHLHSLDKLLLQTDTRQSKEKLNELLADDFLEYGSSGRIFDKANILSRLPNEEDPEFSLMDFEARQLASKVVLTTYRVIRRQDMTHSLRSSIWQLNEGKWQMTFHQGTKTTSN
ncbi:DUF4440 domain-containing protein [Aquibacillus halophilus]|uniref:DUF4440 domain-containing protein n=1 Tax=Aquibacillus halophilus TaxID=930132 RepID=A0A6A8DCR9_9BACI|nr:DUF4440 domain-containing protein [Aquibacillus halophilus]MRH43473.1 DUF4440 domain-containing protein [Aquibacillus halophilus]